MCVKQRRQSGFTLIELIVFIVIVSVGLAGVLTSLNFSVQHSADPLQPKQALAIAESMLEEILLKNYSDPGAAACAASPAGARNCFDDVSDYATYSQNPVTSADASIAMAGYSVAVSVPVATVTINGVAMMKQITVTVTYGGSKTISLTGYRANY
jgi:MSHA pilin protein MshD